MQRRRPPPRPARLQRAAILALAAGLTASLLLAPGADAKKSRLADPKSGKLRDIRPVARGDYSFQILEPTRSRTRVERFFPFLEVSGMVKEAERESSALDIVFALDKSSSVTRMNGGTVTEPEGFLGLPQGSRLNIYQAQLKASLAFIERISSSPAFRDSDLLRIGLITLAGPDPSSKDLTLIKTPFSPTYRPSPPELMPWMLRDSTVALPLTTNLMDARVAFEAEFFDKPDARSGTNFAAGVTRAILELAGEDALARQGVSGESQAQSETRPASRKVVMFLTDLSPSLPGGNASKGLKVSGWASDLSADIASSLGVQIHAFSWGRIALAFQRKSRSFPLTNLAIRTGGLFTQVDAPGELVRKLANVSMSGLYDVEIVNKAALEERDYRKPEVEVGPDGSFRARVPMVEDALNEVEVTAQIMSGEDLSRTFYVDFSKAEAPATQGEQEIYEEKERVLADLRAHMARVRANAQESSSKRVRARIELSPAEIRQTRAYCKAVEDPMATRVIQAQIDRCRAFRRDYPEHGTPPTAP